MMGRQAAQGALFYDFRLDNHLPANHLLRRTDGLLDFGFVREALAASYSTSGRPSIDPELMLRMLLVGYLFGIRSERRLCEELRIANEMARTMWAMLTRNEDYRVRGQRGLAAG